MHFRYCKKPVAGTYPHEGVGADFERMTLPGSTLEGPGGQYLKSRWRRHTLDGCDWSG